MDDNAEVKQAKVVRIGIGRLFNLGNYEHIRFDITVDIPEGADVRQTVRRLREILKALKPLPKDNYDLARAKRAIAQEAEALASDAVFNRVDPVILAQSQEVIARHEEKMAKRQAALMLFNDLGGASVYTDAKDKWEDDMDWDD